MHVLWPMKIMHHPGYILASHLVFLGQSVNLINEIKCILKINCKSVKHLVRHPWQPDCLWMSVHQGWLHKSTAVGFLTASACHFIILFTKEQTMELRSAFERWAREGCYNKTSCWVLYKTDSTSHLFQRGSYTSRSLIQCAQELFKTLFSSGCSGDTMKTRSE